MSDRKATSKVVDEIIRFVAVSGTLAVGMAIPNALIGLEKPLNVLLNTLDKRERERELRRIISNMKSSGYLVSGSYDHGLQLTDKARKRLEKIEFDSLAIAPSESWDGFWRIVLYDIPEAKKHARNALNTALRRIGCFQLQRSVWITPFPCRREVEIICVHFDVADFVTYFEARNLDNEKTMTAYFKRKYPATHF